MRLCETSCSSRKQFAQLFIDAAKAQSVDSDPFAQLDKDFSNLNQLAIEKGWLIAKNSTKGRAHGICLWGGRCMIMNMLRSSSREGREGREGVRERGEGRERE